MEFFLTHNYYSFLFFIAFLVLISTAVNIYMLRSLLRNITCKSWLILFFILTLNYLIWKLYTPHIPHVYYDQFYHMDIAHNLAQNNLNIYTLKGNLDFNELPGKPSHYPPGYHYLLSLAFNNFGSTENVAFSFSFILGLIAIILYFLCICHINEDQETALWSAFLLSITPVFLQYSATYSLEVCSLLFIILTVLSAVNYYKNRDWYLLFAFIIIFCFTCYIRVENFILITLTLSIFVILISLLKRKNIIFFIKSHCITLAIIIPLLCPLFFQVYYSFNYLSPKGWSPEIIEYINRFFKYIGHNLLFFFGSNYPLVFVILSIIGFVILIRKRKEIDCCSILIILWGIVCILFYSCYIDFLFNFDSERHTLNIYITLCFLGGVCLAQSLKSYSGVFKFYLIILSVIFMCFSSKPCLDKLVLKSNTRVLYLEYVFIKSLERCELDNDIYIVRPSCVSEIVFLLNHKAMSINQLLLDINQMDRIYIFQDSEWPIYCSNNDENSILYQEINTDFEARLIKSTNTDDYDFRLYMYIRKK